MQRLVLSGEAKVMQLGRTRAIRLAMSTSATFAFLGDPSQSAYIANVLRRSTDATKQALQDGAKLIEIEFPSNRKNDLSVTETLDTTRAFVREFVKDSAFSSLGKDMWVLFPDKSESSLARKKWGENLPFTLSSIEGALSDTAANSATRPKLIMCVSPGFNVEEWIALEKLEDRQAPIICINGNLDRLRNGYYPWFFYPELTRVTKAFYSRFTQALFLNPIAVSGDRLGAWLCKLYNSPWLVLVKANERGSDFDIISSTEREPDAKTSWAQASSEYKKRTGRMF